MESWPCCWCGALSGSLDYCKTDRDKMIAGVMAAVLATQGTAWASAWALAVGFGLNIFLSNWSPFEKKKEQKENSEA